MRLLLSFVFFVSALPFAVADDSFHYGYLGTAQWVTINDPDGKTESRAVLVPLGVYVAFDSSRDMRYRVDLSYLTGSMNAGDGQVGQDYTSLIMGASVNWRLRFTRSLKPWVGMGVSLSQSEFSTRYTIDSGGFLASEYPDRSSTGYAATAIASNYWDWTRDIKLGVEAMVDIPLSTDLRRIGLGVSVLF